MTTGQSDALNVRATRCLSSNVRVCERKSLISRVEADKLLLTFGCYRTKGQVTDSGRSLRWTQDKSVEICTINSEGR